MQKIYFYIHIRTYTYIPFIIAQIFRKICIDSIDLDLQFVLDSVRVVWTNSSSVHVTINRNGRPVGASDTEWMTNVNMDGE